MYLKNINLKNKTALVTGAGKGIGLACAIALAEAGANLIVISRTQKDLDKVSKIIRRFKSKCVSYACDITNYTQVKNFINKQKKLTSWLIMQVLIFLNILQKLKKKIWNTW